MQAAQWQIALSGVVPAVVAMWFVDRLDRKRPEPARTRRLVALAGMASVIPAIILELIIAGGFEGVVGPGITFQGASFDAFVGAAIPEEACKILVVYWVVWRRPEFDERMDGIVYAGRAGLGFALVENVMYLLGTEPSGQLQVWILRAVLAVPGHAMWTGMIGAMAARRRFDGKGLGLWGGYFLAVAFHGAYDLSLMVQSPLTVTGRGSVGMGLLIVPVGLTIGAFFTLRSMARTALILDDADAERATVAAALRQQRLAEAQAARQAAAAPAALG